MKQKLEGLWEPPTEISFYKIKNIELDISQCIMISGHVLLAHDSG